MILFDYEKIYLLSYGRADLILRYFTDLVEEPDANLELVGSSFVLNPYVITDNPYGYDARTLAEYLGLLSIRNLASTKLDKDSSLSMMLVYPWIPRQVVESNPLVTILKDKLIFKEEEKIWLE